MLRFSLFGMLLLSTSAQAESPVSEAEEIKVASPWAMVLPFGVPQFATQRTKLGVVFGGLQAIGVAGAVYSGVEMIRFAEENEVDQELLMRDISKFFRQRGLLPRSYRNLCMFRVQEPVWPKVWSEVFR